MTVKKFIAKEWLLILKIWLVIGIAMGLILLIALTPWGKEMLFKIFPQASDFFILFPILIFSSFYGLIWFVRSIRWAIKTSRE